MRRCDKCGNAVPKMDRIEIAFWGKLADKARKLMGEDRLSFCSMRCLAAFQAEDFNALKAVEA